MQFCNHVKVPLLLPVPMTVPYCLIAANAQLISVCQRYNQNENAAFVWVLLWNFTPYNMPTTTAATTTMLTIVATTKLHYFCVIYSTSFKWWQRRNKQRNHSFSVPHSPNENCWQIVLSAFCNWNWHFVIQWNVICIWL